MYSEPCQTSKMERFSNIIQLFFAKFLQNTPLERDLIILLFEYPKPQPPSAKKDALKNFVKFTGKHLCWSLFFKNFKILGTPILKNISERLLLLFAETMVGNGDIFSVFTKRRKSVQ